MPAYLTVTFEYACAEDVIDGFPGVNAASHTCEPVSTAPPVVLPGLVRGGEFVSVADWGRNVGPDAVLCLSADGRAVTFYNHARAAEARGALPITWYRYEEA